MNTNAIRYGQKLVSAGSLTTWETMRQATTERA